MDNKMAQSVCAREKCVISLLLKVKRPYTIMKRLWCMHACIVSVYGELCTCIRASERTLYSQVHRNCNRYGMPFHVSTDSYGKIFTTKCSFFRMHLACNKCGKMERDTIVHVKEKSKNKIWRWSTSECSVPSWTHLPIDIEMCAKDSLRKPRTEKKSNSNDNNNGYHEKLRRWNARCIALN